MGKKVLILGGGVGGYSSAKKLVRGAKELGVDLDVTLVEREERHYMPPLFFDVALGYASPDETWAPVKNMEKLGIKVVQDEVQAIDAGNRAVAGAKAKYQYDYLIVALGSEMKWDAYPDLSGEGYHNFTLEDALKMREALKSVRDGQNITVLVPDELYRCGVYPYELVTVLADFYKARGRSVSIRLLDPHVRPVIMSNGMGLGSAISRFLEEEMAARGIEYVPKSKLVRVEPGNKKVLTESWEYKYDLLIKVPPPGLPKPLAQNEDFVFKPDPRWTPVLPTGRHPKFDDVYFAGEHSLPPLGIGLAGVFVESLATTSVTNLLGDAAGGFGPAFMPSPVSCVAYAGTRGWGGLCEMPYDPKMGMYMSKCYFLGAFAPMRLLKQAFYHGWLDGLRGGAE